MMELVPTRIVAGGDALARADDGRIVLVDGALPGERVRVGITADRADHLRALATDVLEPSPARITEPCAHARQGCGGCTWQHVDVDAQRQYKRDIVVDALRRIAHVDDPPLADTVALPSTGYRTTVRALVHGGRAAFRRRRSHEPVDVDSCLVAHPLVDELLRDGRFPGAREVTIRVGANTGERAVRTDPARGREAHIHEVVEGARLRISMRSFFQSRADGAAALAQLVRAAVGRDRVVADLYCGVGLFAARLDEPRRVVAVERDRFAVGDARHNVAGRVVRADVDAWRPERVDVVVADPSRAGLRRAGADTVLACRPERIVLISCDAAALARDTKLLTAGGYRMRSVTPVDLFPHTPHVECVTILDI
jgi:23S rRNA (uracil1939-C5)-methyltransferase